MSFQYDLASAAGLKGVPFQDGSRECGGAEGHVLSRRISRTAYSAVASFPWYIAVQAALMFVMAALSSLTWALFGSSLRSFLTSPTAVRVFNVLMAILLLASLYPVLMDA